MYHCTCHSRLISYHSTRMLRKELGAAKKVGLLHWGTKVLLNPPCSSDRFYHMCHFRLTLSLQFIWAKL